MSNSEISILILSKKSDHAQKLVDILPKTFGPQSHIAHASTIAWDAMIQAAPQLVIVDLTTDSYHELQFISKMKDSNIPTLCVAIAPHSERSMHIEAMRSGAQATISTPLHEEEISLTVSNLFFNRTSLGQPKSETPGLRERDGFYGIVGNSPVMHKLYETIARLGEEGESTVLIQGESGVGKELVAMALHRCSPRAKRNFVPVNCAAIPDSLLESELFGHEKGAFTGATQKKKGRLDLAQGGTLFLDEIGEMQPTLQTKLLRVIQEREFEPLGTVKPVQVDTRIIAATNIDLEQAVKNNSFRTDLYYRLSVVPLYIPPLRKRQVDIPLLLHKFALLYNRGKQGKPKEFSPEAIHILQKYSWPGNVRELMNLVQRVCVLHRGSIIHVDDLPEEYRVVENKNTQCELEDELGGITEENLHVMRDSEIDFNKQISEYEDRLILQALIATNGNKKQAAKRLNLKRTTLLEKIKKKELNERYSHYSNVNDLKE